MFKIISTLFLVVICLSLTLSVNAYVPSDPMYSSQNYLSQINIDQAWDEAKGRGVVVAVLDSGVDIDHPDLKFNIWKNSDEIADDGIDNDENGFIDDISGWDFVSDSPDPRPKLNEGYTVASVNHGTAIAGLIGAVANNAQGLTGIAFYSKIMPIRILNGEGIGEVSDLVKAIEYAVNNGADIINLSLVGYDYSQSLENIIEWASNNGVFVVAAAGNTNADVDGIDLDQNPAYPACYGDNTNNNWVLAVSSVDPDKKKSFFSNYGTVCIDLTAPGENILSLAYYNDQNDDFSDYYSYNWNGTSFSTALTSGVSALVKSKDLSISPSQIAQTIRDNADNIDGINSTYQGQLGAGLLNAQSALESDISLVGGRLVRLVDSSAVYYVINNQRRLFSNEATYWSWYSGTWLDQPIEIVSQQDFDNLVVGENITVRPGTNLIKFSNSSLVYAVSSNGIINRLGVLAAEELYGANWQEKVVVIQIAFETNYRRGLSLSGNIFPNGSLIQYINSDDIWYIDNGYKRKVSPDAFLDNSFQMKYLIEGVSSDIFYPSGKTINSLDQNIFSYFLEND